MERLAGNLLRYGTGSRIIFTSRERGTLGQTVEEDKIYEVGRLKPDDAVQLFYSRAFKNTCITDYKGLAEKAMHYAGGIPLALVLLGSSFLNCKSKEDLEVMSNLRLLIVDGGYKLNASLDLPDSLRYLEWWEYSLESLPSKFSPENLVELHMPYNKVTKEFWKEEQRLVNLQVIDLHDSTNLTEVPNLSWSLKIVNINLCGCESLVEIPEYFQHLDKLTHLDLQDCTSLKYLPEMPGNIKYLDLQESGIKELPKSVWSNENISYLNISYCYYLEKLPSNSCKLKVSGSFDLQSCVSLREFSELPRDITILSLVGCSSLVSLPINIWKLKYLKELNLDGCYELEHFPEVLEPMEHLVSLSMQRTAVRELPSSFGNLIGLQTLDLSGCKHLKVVPTSIYRLTNLKRLNFNACRELEKLPSSSDGFRSLEVLDLSDSSILKIPACIKQASRLSTRF